MVALYYTHRYIYNPFVRKEMELFSLVIARRKTYRLESSDGLFHSLFLSLFFSRKCDLDTEYLIEKLKSISKIICRVIINIISKLIYQRSIKEK